MKSPSPLVDGPTTPYYFVGDTIMISRHAKVRLSKSACKMSTRHLSVVSNLPPTDDSSSLQRPVIIDQDNHLLVINKPAGWHSVPNNQRSSEKSLMTFCKNQRWGGGSQKDFLSPLHRLDQPCSGLQLYGKTSKAASRIQSKWKDVAKLYICVLDGDVRRLTHFSSPKNDAADGSTWYEMGGYLHLPKHKQTVVVHPLPTNPFATHVSICWKSLTSGSRRQFTLVAVKTQHGQRHMIRVLLSQGCPLAGDLRYGASAPLPDQSVALHAYALRLPSTLQLGSVEPGKIFRADVPPSWADWFGIRPQSIADELGDLETLLAFDKHS